MIRNSYRIRHGKTDCVGLEIIVYVWSKVELDDTLLTPTIDMISSMLFQTLCNRSGKDAKHTNIKGNLQWRDWHV